MTPKVLVVDDSTMLRQQVRRTLRNLETVVIEAEDEVEALRELTRHLDIALILCDFKMPRMDGLDFLERVRADARFRGTPIVILTTEALAADVRRARDLGVHRLLLKPFREELFVATVQKLIAKAAA